MKIRSLFVVASVAALCACNQSPANTSGPSASTNTGGALGGGGLSSGNTAGRTVDPQLAQEISLAVQMLKPQLPIRQGPVTITNIDARGGELIYTMEVPNDMNQASFQQFQANLPVQACANAQARQLFERGGAYTYIIKDSGGEEFRTSVSSC